MRQPVVGLLLLASFASAQGLVPSADLARLQRDFEAQAGDQALRCEVTQLNPALDFAFRFQAGYVFHVPESPSASSVRVLTAINPDDAPSSTTYLFERGRIADLAKTGSNFEIPNRYFLGPGRYSVDATLRDDRNGVCRKQWHVVVEQSHANRLLDRLPATSVRVVIFSLEQQREVFRSDRFTPSDVARLVEAITAFQTATVDVNVLSTPQGHVTFLAGLIDHEENGPDAADTIVFLGPTSRYSDKMPKGLLSSRNQSHTRLFYVRYDVPQNFPAVVGRPVSSSGTDSWTGQSSDPTAPKVSVSGGAAGSPSHGLPDVITAAVSALNGRTLLILTPFELAKAIQTIGKTP